MRGAFFAMLLLSAFAGSASAQENPRAVLAYADDLFEVTVFDFTGEPIGGVDFGSELLIGFGIQTGATTAELRFEPNGSIFRMAENTFLKIEELQGLNNTRVNSVALARGGLRVVAALTQGQNYRVTTPAGAMGVRGTDFVISLDSADEATVVVDSGIVEVFDPTSRESIRVGAGEALRVSERVLERIEAEMDEVRRRIREAEFAVLEATEVPREVTQEFRNEFAYFEDLEAESFREFFADENLFADAQEYIERYRSYYEREMQEFQSVLERERRAREQRRQEEEGAVDRESNAFEQWRRRNEDE